MEASVKVFPTSSNNDDTKSYASENDVDDPDVKVEPIPETSEAEIETEFEVEVDDDLDAEIDGDVEAEIDEGDCCFLCGACRQWFRSKSSLVIHFLGHFHDCPKCETCGAEFTEARDFADHCIMHVGYTCFVCEDSFLDVSAFQAHKLNHKLTCFTCKKNFPTENAIHLHYPEHETIVNVQCELCKNYYSSKRSLRYHMSSQHSIHTKIFKCELCSDTFTQSGSLRRHYMVIHENFRPFVCHLCGKQYCMKNSLTSHLLKHAGEKPYTCLVCGSSFADKRQFKRHGIEHIPNQSDPCGICGKVFQTKMKLKIHFRQHTNQRKFECEKCGRRYNYSSHLKRHTMLHNNERPFDCERCGKCFIVRSELTRHLMKKHLYDKQKAKDAINDIVNGVSDDDTP